MFHPSFYTIINQEPVLIHSGLKGNVAADNDFINFIISAYWNKPVKEQEKRKYLEKDKIVGADSFTVWDDNLKKSVKIAASNMVSLDLNNEPRFPVEPKKCILIFKQHRLVSQTWLPDLGSQ